MSRGAEFPGLRVPFLPQVLPGTKRGGGTARGTGAGRVCCPSQPCQPCVQRRRSSNARAPAVRVAPVQRRTWALSSGGSSGREEQSGPGTQQTEHTLPKAACKQRSGVLAAQVGRHAGLRATGKPGEVPSSPSHPRPADSSPSESLVHKMIPSNSELFAASVGNVDWLRFCLNREHREVIVDDKVKRVAWRQGLKFPNTRERPMPLVLITHS